MVLCVFFVFAMVRMTVCMIAVLTNGHAKQVKTVLTAIGISSAFRAVCSDPYCSTPCRSLPPQPSLTATLCLTLLAASCSRLAVILWGCRMQILDTRGVALVGELLEPAEDVLPGRTK